MMETLQKVGKEGTYLNIIKATCGKPTANIILNGEKLKSFPLTSEIRQRCTLLPLFIKCSFERITTNCGKFLKIWEYQTTLPASWETCMPLKKQQLEPDVEQWTGSKLGNEYVKSVYGHPACLNYMQSTSCEMSGWTKLKLESRLPGEISIISDMQMTPPICQKAKRN